LFQQLFGNEIAQYGQLSLNQSVYLQIRIEQQSNLPGELWQGSFISHQLQICKRAP